MLLIVAHLSYRVCCDMPLIMDSFLFHFNIPALQNKTDSPNIVDRNSPPNTTLSGPWIRVLIVQWRQCHHLDHRVRPSRNLAQGLRRWLRHECLCTTLFPAPI